MNAPINRRKFLRHSLLAGGAAVGLSSIEEKVLADEIRTATPTTPNPRAADRLQLPRGKIGSLEISRVICGGNLIGGWAHSRDLIYVSTLVKAYHTDEKIFDTLHLAEQRGINTVLTNPSAGRVLSDYWHAEGGKIQWISDCATADIKAGIKQSVDDGAHAIYIQGSRCDQMVRDNRLAELEQAVSLMREQGVPWGLGAHSLDTVRACVKAGFEPDFWAKTLHQDNYWSATPADRRLPFDEVNGKRRDHDRHHDNMWCTDASGTIACMGALKQPWIAFKVLAAGAIHPRQAFQWAFESGADFICVGMFDFQVVENSTIAQRALENVTQAGRSRPWRA